MRLFLLAACCLLPSASLAARADTYLTTTVATDDIGQFVAGDDFGDYVIDAYGLSGLPGGGQCGSQSSSCYFAFVDGTGTYTNASPTLPSDPTPIAGSGCVPQPSGFSGLVFCNNGHQIFSGTFYVNGQEYIGTYDGADPITDEILGPNNQPTLAGQQGILTANGDFYYDDQEGDNLDVAIDRTSITPEPSSIALLSTGLCGLAGVVRKRLTRKALRA